MVTHSLTQLTHPCVDRIVVMAPTGDVLAVGTYADVAPFLGVAFPAEMTAAGAGAGNGASSSAAVPAPVPRTDASSSTAASDGAAAHSDAVVKEGTGSAAKPKVSRPAALQAEQHAKGGLKIDVLKRYIGAFGPWWYLTILFVSYVGSMVRQWHRVGVSLCARCR